MVVNVGVNITNNSTAYLRIGGFIIHKICIPIA